MYSSIQINQLPIKLRLGDLENQSCGSRNKESPSKYFGNISPKKKKLISNLIPAEGWELGSKEFDVDVDKMARSKACIDLQKVSNHDRTNSS